MRIRRGEASDQAEIEAIVKRGYCVYVERIGLRPGPMDDDYAEQLSRGIVSVLEEDGVVVGLIVLAEDGDRLVIENVAVDPDRQGEGLGGRLLAFAEETARAAGIETVALYTHEKMSENIALYKRLGYVEDERRRTKAHSRVFARVFMSKRLVPPER